jgi:hypothetical protein
MTPHRTLYLVISLGAALAAGWLALHALGFIFRVALLAAAVAVAIAAVRAWRASAPGGGGR